MTLRDVTYLWVLGRSWEMCSPRVADRDGCTPSLECGERGLAALVNLGLYLQPGVMITGIRDR